MGEAHAQLTLADAQFISEGKLPKLAARALLVVPSQKEREQNCGGLSVVDGPLGYTRNWRSFDLRSSACRLMHNATSESFRLYESA